MLINKNGIYYRKWQAKKPKAVILAVHGMGASSERFTDMGKFFVSKKMSVYAIALRGFGELSQVPGHVGSLKLYYEDIAKLKEIIKKDNPDVPIFILGESMGAVISHTIAVDYDSDYKGIIEVVPVYNDVMKISIMQRAAIAFVALFNPSKPVAMPFKSEELTRDQAVLKRLKSDKREHRFASGGLLVGILLMQVNAMRKTGKMKVPVLFLLAGRDYLNDTHFAVKLFNKLKGDKEMYLYKDSFHALTIEKNRKEVFGDMLGWMTKKIK